MSVRKLGALTDPTNPDRGRRRIFRHLAGTQPTRKYRRLYAELLEAPELAGEDGDVETDTAARITRAVKRALARAS